MVMIKIYIMIIISLNIIFGTIIGSFDKLPLYLLLIPFIINTEILYIKFLKYNWDDNNTWYYKKIMSMLLNIYITLIIGSICTLIPTHLKETLVVLGVLSVFVIFFMVNYYIGVKHNGK